MTTPCQTITHKHSSYSVLKQLCRIQLVLGGEQTVGLLALALVLILELALDSVQVHLTLVLALTLGKLALILPLALGNAH